MCTTLTTSGPTAALRWQSPRISAPRFAADWQLASEFDITVPPFLLWICELENILQVLDLGRRRAMLFESQTLDGGAR